MRSATSAARAMLGLIGLVLVLGFPLKTFCQTTEASDPFGFALQLYRDGMYLPAAEEFLSVAEASPNRELSEEAKLWAARSYCGAGQWPRAIALLEALTAGSMEKSRACAASFLLGRSYEKIGAPDRALDAYATLVGRYPDCPQQADAALRSGFLSLGLGQPARALAFYSRVGEASSDSVRMHAALGRARALASLGRREEAAAALEIVVESDRALIGCDLRLEAGQVYRELDRLTEAAAAYGRAAASCADSTRRFEAWVALGELQNRMEHWEEAGEARETAAGLVAGDKAVRQLTLAAEAYARAGLWEAVIRVFSAARSVGADLSPESMLTLAHAYREEEAFSAAVQTYSALESGAGEKEVLARARWEVAQTCLAAGWFRLAANSLERFWLLEPEHPRAPEALRLAGEILVDRLGRPAGAAEVFERVAAEYPYSPEAPEALLRAAGCWLQMAQVDRGRRAYERILAEHPTSPAAPPATEGTRLIEIYWDRDWEAARRRMEGGVPAEDPGRALFLGDVVFENLKDYRSARAHYGAALSVPEADPDGRLLYRLGVCSWRLAADPRGEVGSAESRAMIEEAARALGQVVSDHPGGRWAERSEWVLDRIALSSYTGEEEGRILLELELVERFLAKYPGGEHGPDAVMALGRAHERLARLGAGEHYVTAAEYFGQIPESDGARGTEALLATARCWSGAGRFDEAASRYARLRETFQGRSLLPELLFRHAESLRGAEADDEAVRLLGDLVETYPRSPWSTRAAIGLGDVLAASGLKARAAGFYERAIDRAVEPSLRERAELGLAECLGAMGKRAEATALLDALIFRARGRPVADRARLARGRVLERVGDLEGAAETYRTLIASTPSEDLEAEVWARLGGVLLAGGRDVEAAGALRAARAARLPEGFELSVLSNLALALYRSDRGREGDSVLVSLREKSAPDTTLARVVLERGRQRVRAGETAEGIRMFAMVMENFPADDLGYTARYEIGLCHLRAREYEEARDILRTIVDGNPGLGILADAWFKLGSTYYLTGEFERASASYRRVLELRPEGRLVREASFNLGLSLEKEKRWVEAAEVYRTLLARYPEYEERDRVAFKVGYALQEAGRYGAAIEAYEAARPGASPEIGAEIQFWMAECLVRAKDPQKAILAFLRISYLFPEQTMWAATGELRAAELYARAGSVDEARRIYGRVIERYGADSQWGLLAGEGMEALGPAQGLPAESEGDGSPR